VKLPFLIEHFIEHKEKNSSMSVWEFLSIHYSQNTLKDADYSKDMKLPFKSHDGCANINIPVFISNSFSYSILKPIHPNINTYQVLDELLFTSSFHASIWQPPKFI